MMQEEWAQPSDRRWPDDSHAKTSVGALDDLDREIESVGKAVEALSVRTASVRSAYKTEKSENMPRPEPANALRSKIESLAHVRRHLEQITSEIDL